MLSIPLSLRRVGKRDQTAKRFIRQHSRHFEEEIFFHELISNSSSTLDKNVMTILQCWVLFLKLFEVLMRRVRSQEVYRATINRLGVNVLLDCVGFGSVASVACANHILGDKLKAMSSHELSGDFEVGWRVI